MTEARSKYKVVVTSIGNVVVMFRVIIQRKILTLDSSTCTNVVAPQFRTELFDFFVMTKSNFQSLAFDIHPNKDGKI